jgi:hypothetical protein
VGIREKSVICHWFGVSINAPGQVPLGSCPGVQRIKALAVAMPADTRKGVGGSYGVGFVIGHRFKVTVGLQSAVLEICFHFSIMPPRCVAWWRL